ncbi:response regulator transcription factor [Pyxidicoccus sp. 3LG]
MAQVSLRSSQVKALVQLLNEAHELSVSQGERPRHLLSGLRRIMGADVAACVLERDFRPGERGDFTPVFLDGWDGTTLPACQALVKQGSAYNPGIRALMERRPRPGVIATATRRELVGDRAWYGSPYVEHYLQPAHLDDSLYSSRWKDEPAVVQGIGIFRGRNERPFDAADRELLHLFHSECAAMLSAPEPPGDDALMARLAPRERQTLELLLHGLADKEIAARLGISRFTVNQYTKSIYRRFGVQTRAALLARLLGHPERATAPGARLPPS